jgi:hypothetical protein
MNILSVKVILDTIIFKAVMSEKNSIMRHWVVATHQVGLVGGMGKLTNFNGYCPSLGGGGVRDNFMGVKVCDVHNSIIMRH